MGMVNHHRQPSLLEMAPSPNAVEVRLAANLKILIDLCFSVSTDYYVVTVAVVFMLLGILLISVLLRPMATI